MKTFILLAAILFCYGTIHAQDISASEVPEVVKNALLKTHPNPKDVEWERKGEYYNVEYEIGRHDHELWISPSGQIVKHKEELSANALPQGLRNKIKSDYKGYKVDDVDKLTIGNQVLYKIELESGRGSNKTELDLILDENGNSQDNKMWYQMPR